VGCLSSGHIYIVIINLVHSYGYRKIANAFVEGARNAKGGERLLSRLLSFGWTSSPFRVYAVEAVMGLLELTLF
jgi:hypothetical protein